LSAGGSLHKSATRRSRFFGLTNECEWVRAHVMRPTLQPQASFFFRSAPGEFDRLSARGVRAVKA
jgi:hypothetical protein